MFSIRVTLGVCISLMAILLVPSAFGQPMPGKTPSIILSKGMTIHRIDDPTTPPRTFSQIADNRRITPVPAGKLLLRFDDQMLDSAEGRRLLVLTEDGVWGYVRADNGLFEAEARLREIYESRDIRHVILVQDQLANLPTLSAPVLFGRGEIYKTDSLSDDSDTEIILTQEKRRDILKQNPARTSADVPVTATLPTGALATIDVVKALPEQIPFGRTRRTTLAEYQTIFGSWRKAIPEPAVASYKPCHQSKEEVRTRSNIQNLKAEGSLGGEISWLAWVKAKLHLNAELAKKSESTFKEVFKTSDDVEVLIKGWSINTDLEKSTLFLLQNTNCKDEQTWYTAQSDEFGRKDFRIEKLDLNSVNVTYEPWSGIVMVRCYDDYLGLLHQISTRLDLSEQDTGFLLSHISRLRNWRTFFSHTCT